MKHVNTFIKFSAAIDITEVSGEGDDKGDDEGDEDNGDDEGDEENC